MKKEKWLLFCAAVCMLSGCQAMDRESSLQTESAARTEETQTRDAEQAADTAAAWQLAASEPFAPYPETVTYTLGKMTGADNSSMPQGDTYKNNAYTRYLKKTLNVQNQDVFEARDEQYVTNVEMCIATGNLPDVMVINDQEVLKRLVSQDLIEDLTDAFASCTSSRIRSMYASYGDTVLENASFDGRLMALPETNIAEGPNLLWLRRDWMDKLGLDAPKTLDDAVAVIRAFLAEDPGNNGAGETIGLICAPELAGGNGYSAEYMTDIIFACSGAYPKQWIAGEDGLAVYGSVQPQTKEALIRLHDLYEEGVLDRSFLLRSTNNLIELIVDGKCGSFFGPWWAPNNPLMEAVKSDPSAVWEPFLIATDPDGKTSYHSQNPSYKYVVVRKGYEHPEIVFKIASVIFDRIRFEESDPKEFVDYYQKNVDPTARPLPINLDYRDALKECYRSICGALDGTIPVESLEMLEQSYYEYCRAYLEHPKTASSEEWAAYASRIQACALIGSETTREVKSLFFGTTATMSDIWWRLEDLEEETFLKIVTGEEDADAFDRFVEQWCRDGGEVITKEVRESLASFRSGSRHAD